MTGIVGPAAAADGRVAADAAVLTAADAAATGVDAAEIAAETAADEDIRMWKRLADWPASFYLTYFYEV